MSVLFDDTQGLNGAAGLRRAEAARRLIKRKTAQASRDDGERMTDFAASRRLVALRRPNPGADLVRREVDCFDCRVQREAIANCCGKGHLSTTLCHSCWELALFVKSCDTCAGFGTYDVFQERG